MLSGERTAQRLVYLNVFGSVGKCSATIVTLYPPFSWILTAVVRPTTPGARVLRVQRREGYMLRTCADDDNGIDRFRIASTSVRTRVRVECLRRARRWEREVG